MAKVVKTPVDPYDDGCDEDGNPRVDPAAATPVDPWDDGCDEDGNPRVEPVVAKPVDPWDDGCDEDGNPRVDPVVAKPVDPWDDGCDEDGNPIVKPTDIVKVKDAGAGKTQLVAQRGQPFRKGKSGNPTGRPKGARNRVTLMAENLLGERAEALVNKVIERALAGDPVALRLCFERLVPIQRERPLVFELPPLNTPADAHAATQMIAAGVSRGELTASDAATLVSLVEVSCRTYAQVGLESRFAALEASLRRYL